MTPPPSSLWLTELPAGLERQLTELFAAAAAKSTPVQIFFRADDIGRMDRNFVRMMKLFDEHDIPLCPALVPEWLTADSWRQIRALSVKEKLFCWHQHGFAHVNHEQTGKKNEFGDTRPAEAVHHDIRTGRRKLENLVGSAFLPVFTPPWNRCSSTGMQILLELGFSALSRSTGVAPPAPAGLPDLTVNIDLHTRREAEPHQGMNNLLTECRTALNSGRMGFMLHHQRMNETAFLFLEHLFAAIKGRHGIVLCTFRELLEDL